MLNKLKFIFAGFTLAGTLGLFGDPVDVGIRVTYWNDPQPKENLFFHCELNNKEAFVPVRPYVKSLGSSFDYNGENPIVIYKQDNLNVKEYSPYIVADIPSGAKDAVVILLPLAKDAPPVIKEVLIAPDVVVPVVQPYNVRVFDYSKKNVKNGDTVFVNFSNTPMTVVLNKEKQSVVAAGAASVLFRTKEDRINLEVEIKATEEPKQKTVGTEVSPSEKDETPSAEGKTDTEDTKSEEAKSDESSDGSEDRNTWRFSSAMIARKSHVSIIFVENDNSEAGDTPKFKVLVIRDVRTD